MKMPQFRTGNVAIRDALNVVAEYAKRHGINPGGRSGWSETADGWMPPPTRAATVEPEVFWDITVVDRSQGTVSVECADILKDASDLTEGITILSATSTFTAVANQWLYLKFEYDVGNAPKVTLKSGPDWTDFPSRYEIETIDDVATFKAYYYPLWSFSSTGSADSVVVKTDNDGIPTVYADRIAENSHFELIYTIYLDETDGPFLVPKFIPSHALLP